jgi:hypothetical protein
VPHVGASRDFAALCWLHKNITDCWWQIKPSQPRSNRLVYNNAQHPHHLQAHSFSGQHHQHTTHDAAATSRRATGSHHILRRSMASLVQFLDLATPPRNSLEHMSGFQNTLQIGATTSVQSLLQPRREKGLLLDRCGRRDLGREIFFDAAAPARRLRAIPPYPLSQAGVRGDGSVDFSQHDRSQVIQRSATSVARGACRLAAIPTTSAGFLVWCARY